uniref:uncharacterized protein LOC101312505 isoform X2 n=1 Tax=Fragaria vesca subsp. vesca TaxID=101020 RepID=UPI0005C8A5FF|nr:PREDICTED: uncharacterized protein LOC101312505 isoform X2 [Fragaria vesca subsp. vesca]
MGQYRQSGMERLGLLRGNGSDVAIGIRTPGRSRRSGRSQVRISPTSALLVVLVSLVLLLTLLAYFYLSLTSPSSSGEDAQEDDSDFLTNVTRTQTSKVLGFGKGSVTHGRDSRYWDTDDRRRDEDYNEDTPVEVNKEEASLKSNHEYLEKGHDADDEYDDGLDSQQTQMDEYDDTNSALPHTGINYENVSSKVPTHNSRNLDQVDTNSRHPSKRSRSDSKRKAKRRSCEMKFLNSTAQLIEPLESRKFARFSLQYTEIEDKPEGQEQWKPRFAGHQNLQERESSFLARDQKINCGFVKGRKGSPSTGFDLAEDDTNYISRCHIAVISCIFGNSDRLRTPYGKTVSRFSRKNVCFVMFMDKVTLRTLSSEGQTLDRMGFIGLWKIVVVKNLPYADMRRVGKIPKLLPHRLFPSARYSIWLDSKLRLQLDPLLILEYFLWRKGHEYAISNHYDRHCVWEEVAQNKKLNKYNHTIIDEQFAFYKDDGLTRFNALDPNKLLPSNVPEGSFIIRAHTPMSNLFSCLWFNEVERFTPRDQLSFAYTYQKLRRMNPEKPFHLNMFKDCERRAIAKLFRHRSEEKSSTRQRATE